LDGGTYSRNIDKKRNGWKWWTKLRLRADQGKKNGQGWNEIIKTEIYDLV
jgi:hypothetical protein